MLPELSKRPEPELPPATSRFTWTNIPVLTTPVVPVADGEVFFTAPFGWCTPKTASPTAGKLLRTGTGGSGGAPRSCTMA
jgi:hypothetical protein